MWKGECLEVSGHDRHFLKIYLTKNSLQNPIYYIQTLFRNSWQKNLYGWEIEVVFNDLGNCVVLKG
jgi:predicted nuclease of restriction endonuclease-like (RecB) superfamily